MLQKTFIILLCLVYGTSLEIKIGVITTESNVLKQMIPSHVAVTGNYNFSVHIIWGITTDENLFLIAQVGTQLLKQGAVSVFAISNTLQRHPDIDWVLPLVGTGNLTSHPRNYSRQCRVPISNTISSWTGIQDYWTIPFDHLQMKYSIIPLAVLKKLKWQNAILIYDEETDFIVRTLPDQLNVEEVMLTIYRIENNYSRNDLKRFLNNLYRNIKTELFVVVACSFNLMKRLMKEADAFDDNRLLETALYYRSRWLIFNFDGNKIDCFTWVKNLHNIAVVNIPAAKSTIDIPKHLTLQYILKYIANNSKVIANKGNTACLDQSSINDIFQEISQFWIQIRNVYAESKFPISTLMYHSGGRTLSGIGHTSLKGDVDMDCDIFPNIKHGFNEKLFHVSTIYYPPFEYQLKNGQWKGLCMELLQEMSRRLNFTYKLSLVPDNEWGRIYNNSWTGLVGQLARKEVDMVVAPLSTQAQREEVMDFSLCFFYDMSIIIMQKPNPKEKQWRRIIEPLHWEVMLLTACFVPFVTFMLFTLERLTPFHQDKQKIRRLYDHFWYIFGCIFMQVLIYRSFLFTGGSNLPKSQTERTIICCWWTFCIVLAATYCGNLIAFLTVTQEKPPFDSLEEMVNQQEYEWGTQGGAHWMMYFEHATIPMLQAVWSGIEKTYAKDNRALSPSNDIQLGKVREGKYAYIAEKSILEIEASKDCNLYVAKEEFLPLQYGVGLPNNSPFTKNISDLVLYMHETGLLKLWKQKEWPTHSVCSTDLVTEAKPITWMDIQVAFYFVGFGVAFSVLVLIIETTSYFLKSKFSQREQNLRTGISQVNLNQTTSL